MRVLIAVGLLFSLMSSADAFEGCGKYMLKGTLRKDPTSHYKVIYVVNEGSRAQVTLELSNGDVFYKVFHYLDKPTALEVKILKRFDGTKGTIAEVLNIQPRAINPLSAANEGLEKIASLKCM